MKQRPLFWSFFSIILLSGMGYLTFDRLASDYSRRSEQTREADKEATESLEVIKYMEQIRTRDGESGPNYPMNFRMEELQKTLQYSRRQKRLNTAYDWIERGPGNVSNRGTAFRS